MSEIEYEEVSHDDRVIGRAFRVSALALVLLAAAGGGVYWWLNRPKAVAPAQVIDTEAPLAVTHDVLAPAVRFTDVTTQAGIDFEHENGAEGDKLLPETMGGGSAFFDHDGDGDADLLFVNACPWPESQRTEKPTQALYANDGKGRFTNVTAEAGLGATFYGMGAACADVDADGDVDVFFTTVGPNRCFVNESGRFAERDLGLAGASDAWSTCACFFDAERDGDLDLYVGNYVRWSRAIDIEVGFTLSGIGRAYGPPTTFEGTQPYLYRNAGDGNFSEVSQASGLHVTNVATDVPVGKALGVRANDADLDGDLDLMVANDTVANFFYRNLGAGAFEECGQKLGLAFDREGRATGAMGIDAAWFRNDEAIAYAIGNFANEMSSFYVSQGRADLWADEAIGVGIGAPTRKYLKFGTLFLDYDLDGRQDYLQANGHLEDEINQVQASQTYQQPAQLFWNAGNAARRTFLEVASAGDLLRPIVGRGCASTDIDGDGDLDVLLTQSGGKPMLLQNDQALGNHWLRLHLVGSGKNRAAIGARVELVNAGVRQCQDVVPFKSYLSQVELPLTFGLGQATQADKILVHWPDGAQQELTGLAADRLHVIEQAK
ncbi:MAG: CRTAC1 family protein [Planctomycetes bacterium]|nr:CRTAC1 family protein [Planctomycetota bacterium]